MKKLNSEQAFARINSKVADRLAIEQKIKPLQEARKIATRDINTSIYYYKK